jgi:hypothetical protein
MMNLTDIKHALIGTPPVSTPSAQAPQTPNVVKLQVELKHRQLRKGTTRAEVERRTAERDAARFALAQAERAVGEQANDGLDTATAMTALSQAEQVVKENELALSVATQKDALAQAALKDAERTVAAAAVSAACARVLALGPRFEEVCAMVRQLAVDTARETAELRVVGGNEKYAYGANEIKGQFDLFIGLAKHPLTNNGHVPEAFMKYKTSSACLEAICGGMKDGV